MSSELLLKLVQPNNVFYMLHAVKRVIILKIAMLYLYLWNTRSHDVCIQSEWIGWMKSERMGMGGRLKCALLSVFERKMYFDDSFHQLTTLTRLLTQMESQLCSRIAKYHYK